MRRIIVRGIVVLVMMFLVIGVWWGSPGTNNVTGAPFISQVDQLPFASFKGIGPGTFTLDNKADVFLVKKGPRLNEVREETFRASTGEYVWEISGSVDQFTLFISGDVDLGATVIEGCRVLYLHLDDEADQRINRFIIDGTVVHTVNPEQIPEPAGLVIYGEFIAPQSGNLGIRVEDSAAVTFKVVCSIIEVTKTAQPEQVENSGDPVRYTVDIENTGRSSVTIETLVDDQFGDLNNQGTCSVPQTIPVNGSYSCNFSVPVEFEAGSCQHTNIVTAIGTDPEGEPVSDDDDAIVNLASCAGITVTKTPNPSQIEAPGDDVVYSVSVLNTGATSVTIDTLVDDKFGDLNGVGSCSVPQVITPGATYDCSFTEFIEAEEGVCSHVNVVTASGVGENQEPVQGSDDARVLIAPCTEIAVTKTPNPSQLFIPGGDVVFTVSVANTGTTPITIDSLTDDMFGDLNGNGTCFVPQEIAAGESYSCNFTGNVELSAEVCTHVNVVTASGPGVSGQATAEVTCLDRQIRVTKTPSPSVMPIPGGVVTYWVTVTNTGPDEITIDSLVDDKFGDLNGRASCSVPQTIAPGDSYMCAFSGTVVFNQFVCEHDNIVTASGPGVSGQGSAKVICDSEPHNGQIRVRKTANPSQIPAEGGLVTYTATVTNSGTESILINSLIDDKFGDLNGQGNCAVPQTILAGGSYSCTFVAEVEFEDDTCSHVNTITASGPNGSGSGSATVGCEVKQRLPACLRINFEIGPDEARRGTYVVREIGGHLLATWWADNGWMDSGWIDDIDISAPAVYVQVIFVKGDGTEVVMRILNPAPYTQYGWLARGMCHALEVAWP